MHVLLCEKMLVEPKQSIIYQDCNIIIIQSFIQDLSVPVHRKHLFKFYRKSDAFASEL